MFALEIIVCAILYIALGAILCEYLYESRNYDWDYPDRMLITLGFPITLLVVLFCSIAYYPGKLGQYIAEQLEIRNRSRQIQREKIRRQLQQAEWESARQLRLLDEEIQKDTEQVWSGINNEQRSSQ